MDSGQQSMQPRQEARKKAISNLQLLDACQDGRLQDVRDLLQQGADLNFCDGEGDTALHWAVRSGKKDVVTELTGRDGTKLSVENHDRKTPLDLAWDSVKQESDSGLKESKKDAVILPLEEGILKEANHIIDEHQNRPLHEPQESTLSFYEAVLNENSNQSLSEDDIKRILKFFWPAWDEQSEVQEEITFQLVHDDLKCVSLLRTETGIYFAINKSEEPANVPSKSNTEALLKVELFSERLAKEPLVKLHNVKVKLVKELEKLKNMQQSSINDANKFFANVLNEIEITESKFQLLVKLLKEIPTTNRGLSLNRESIPTKFTFQSANVLIFFIETFAFQGIDPRVSLTHDKTVTLSQYKKSYFQRYFPTDEKMYQEVFARMRKTLLKKGNKISPHQIDDFFQKIGLGLKDLIPSMLEFSLHVCSRMKQEMRELPSTSAALFKKIKINLNKFLTGDKDDRLQKSACTSESEIRDFCEKVNKMLGGESHLRDELIFELLVNITPMLQSAQGATKPYIYQLRNIIIHNLGETNQKFHESIALAMHDYYRYELTRKMHDVFSPFRGSICQEALEKELTIALKTVDENFPNIKFYLSDDDSLKSEYSEYSGDWFWTEKNEDDIIHLYLRYMAPIFDNFLDNDDDVEETQMDISDAHKMNIFEDLWHMFMDPVQTNKDEKAREILSKLPLSQSLQLSIHEKCSDSKSELQKEVKEILHNLSFLRLKGKHINHDDVIILFKVFMKNKGVFSCDNHKDLIDLLDLSQEERKYIETCLNDLPNIHTGRKVDGTSVQVNLSSIILSLLKLKHNRHKEYQLRIDSISSAFRDEKCIAYLVSQNIQRDSGGISKLKDLFHTYKVLRDIRGMKYTVPYVATLIAEIKSLEVIETDDHLRSLLASLLQGNFSSQYLEGLLTIRDQRLLEASFSLLMEGTLSGEGIDAFFRALVKVKVHERYLNHFRMKFNEHRTESHIPSIIIKILEAGNAVVLEYIDSDKLDLAQDILRIVDKLIGEWNNDLFKKECEHCYLLQAKLHVQKGRKFCDGKHGESILLPCLGKEHFEEALIVLDMIEEPKEPRHSDRYMLSLSRKAYALYLLGKCTKGGQQTAEKSEQCHNELWQLMWEYVTLSKEKPPEFETFYHRAIFSARYNSLITANHEYRKYLNINSALKITKTFHLFVVHANSKFSKGVLRDIELIEEDLKSWKEIYVTVMKYPELSPPALTLQRYQSMAHNALAYRFRKRKVCYDSLYHRLKAIECNILIYHMSRIKFGQFSSKLRKSVEQLEYLLKC